VSQPTTPPVTVRRGEVWWVDLDPTRGGEIHKTRPAVVLPADALNRARRSVVVVTLSTRPDAAAAPRGGDGLGRGGKRHGVRPGAGRRQEPSNPARGATRDGRSARARERREGRAGIVGRQHMRVRINNQLRGILKTLGLVIGKYGHSRSGRERRNWPRGIWALIVLSLRWYWCATAC
jgi:hypothetical protein